MLSKIRLLLIGTVFITPHLITAKGWMRTFGGPNGDGVYCVEVTSDSGFIMAGTMLIEFLYLGAPAAGAYGYIVKTNSEGFLQWSRTYPPQDVIQHSKFYCIQPTTDSGYIVVGEQTLWLEHATEHLWLLKLSSTGDTVWTRTYGWDVKDDVGSFVRQTPDNGFIITGYTESRLEDLKQKDVWVLRTDSLGDTLWSIIYGSDTELDWGACVIPTSDGNYVVVGGDGTTRNSLIMKIDDEGEVLWTRTYQIGLGDNFCKFVEETSDGGFVITGTSDQTPVYSNLYILKLDQEGDSIWAKRYGNDNINLGTCVRQTPDGGYAVVGSKNKHGDYDGYSDAWLLRMNSLGDTLYTRTYIYYGVKRNEFKNFQFVSDGGYIICGKTGDHSRETIYDAWLVKTDSLGYVPIEEPVTHSSDSPDLEASAPLGEPVEIRYTDMPGGFHAYVFDATGRKVAEIHNANASGTVTWGEGQSPGVYFIRELSGNTPATKVILVQ